MQSSNQICIAIKRDLIYNIYIIWKNVRRSGQVNTKLSGYQMTALSVSGVTLSFGDKNILNDVSFALNDGDKLGIIGVNGAGKTSLFRIITGEYLPESGAVYIAREHTVGMLRQNADLTELPKGMTMLEYMYTAFPDLIDLEEQISDTETRLRTVSGDEAVALSGELSELNRRYAEGGGLEFRSRCKGMLLNLGFSSDMTERRIETLSGGQYTMLSLARLLASEPDILMLDEPTNHLDIDALAWLENFLISYKKTVLVISHDRYFLDKITNKTLHILYTRARLYNGSYTATIRQQEEERESLERRYKEQQKEIARIKANIEFQRRCNRERNYVTIRSKEKQLMRMEKIELAPAAPKEIRISFNAEEQSANDVLELSDVSFSYPDKRILKDLSFLVRRYERVLILGANGCGKSTLMKLIVGRLAPSGGRIKLGYNIKIGYYDQENRNLDPGNTVFSEMKNAYPLKKDQELRATLALFLFGAEDIDKPVSALSGGERARLTLAKLILEKVNLLVMDEPTNHLDIGSREALEYALEAFDGTVIAVSHDRYFINRIATRIIEIGRGGEGCTDYALSDDDDAFSEYMRLREQAAASKTCAVQEPSDGRALYEQRKREEADRRNAEKRIERAKLRAEELERETERLDEELFGPASTDYVRAAEIDKRKKEIEDELLALYEIII